MPAASPKITVLIENEAVREDLAAELGLSLWIDSGEQRILFDTGQSSCFVDNAKQLEIDLTSMNALVLSHGHYDHGGGLRQAAELAPTAQWYIHPSCMTPRLSRCDRPPHKDVGLSRSALGTLRKRAARIEWCIGPRQLASNAWVTGMIPRRTAYEDTGGPFFLDDACLIPDPIVDDQALCIDSPKGLVVVVGCAHAGIVNTLDYISSLAPTEHIYAVIGGLHLLNANEERIALTAQAFWRHKVEIIAPCHCSGTDATAQLLELLGSRVVDCCGGSIFTI